MNNDEFMQKVEQLGNNDSLQSGDNCPEECDKTVHELSHPRNPQLGTKAHTDAPVSEMVCVHHGIVEKTEN